MAIGSERPPAVVLAAALALVAAVALVRLHPLVSADATRPGHDWSDIHQTDALLTERALAEGEWVPYRAPGIQAGAAVFGVPTKPFTYPPFIAAVAAFGPVLGLNLLVLAHVLLGAGGMLLLARRLALHVASGIVLAVLFVLGTYPGSVFLSAPYWGFALAWWPFALVLLLDLLEGRRPLRAGALLGVLLALQLHAGGAFPLYWSGCIGVLLALPYLASRAWWSHARSRLAGMGAVLLTFLGLGAVKLLPMLSWTRSSGRGEPLTDAEIFFTYDRLAEYDQGHPVTTILHIMLFGPDREGVVVLLAATAVGVLFALRRRAGLGALLALAFCVVAGTAVAHDLLKEGLPGYDRMRMPYRFFFPAGMAALVVAGIGIDAVLRALRHRGLRAAAVAALLVAVLWDVRALPGLASYGMVVDSRAEYLAAARPTFEPLLADALPSRLHHERAGDQAAWLPLGLESTTGLLGGDGSANRAYEEWLPFQEPSAVLEARHRGVLDVLNVRYLSGPEPLDLPGLQQVSAPPPTVTPAAGADGDVFVACVAPSGARLGARRSLGGAGLDAAYAVAFDDAGRIHVAGHTATTGFPAAVGPAAAAGDTRLFVTTLDRAADAVLGGAVLPGPPAWGLDLAVLAGGGVAVAGRALAGGGADALYVTLPPAGDGGALERRPERLHGFLGTLAGDAFVVEGTGRAVFADRAGFTVLLRAQTTESRVPAWALRFDHFVPPQHLTPVAAGPGRLHVLKGPPERWRQAVHLQRGLHWGDRSAPGPELEIAAEGIVLRGREGDAAGAAALRFRVAGAARIFRRADDALQLDTPVGALVLAPPHTADGRAGRFTVHGAEVTLVPPAGTHVPLEVLIPLPGGGTGTFHEATAKSVAALPDGAVVLAGSVALLDPAAPPPAGPVARLPMSDGFVTRLRPDGTIAWQTVLGGEQEDFIQAVALDAAGRAHVIGSTRSPESSFPAVVGPDLTFGGIEDAFVARLAPDGAALQFAGYLGGAEGDYGQGIAVDATGRVLVCGDTKSDQATFPVRDGPDLTFNGTADAFVACLAPDGTALEFCGYVGGDGIDVPHDLVLDTAGDLYVPGVTSSTEATFPVQVGPGLTHGGGYWDAFLVKVAGDGTRLRYAGFVGGAGIDRGLAVAVHGDGRACLVGVSQSGRRQFPPLVPGEQASGQTPDRAYLAYLKARHGHPQRRPFERPYVYRRAGCLERAAVVHRPIAVCGPPVARARTLRSLITSPGFDANRHVFVELAGTDDRLPDAAALAPFGGVLLAGLPSSADRAWTRTPAGGLLWLRDGEPSTTVVPLEPGRLRRSLRRIEVDLGDLAVPFLLLSEVMPLQPGWRAAADGVDLPLLRADGLITAVAPPPGTRQVTFAFTPPGLIPGAWITAGTLLVLVVAAFRSIGSARGRVS